VWDAVEHNPDGRRFPVRYRRKNQNEADIMELAAEMVSQDGA